VNGYAGRNRPGRSLKLFVIQAEGAYGLPAALHHQRIERTLMRPGQRPQLGRQGEGQEKMLAGHLLLELALQPLLALMVLAVRTVAMATGVRHEELFVTVATLRLHPWAERGATLLHGGQRPPLAREQAILVFCQQRRLEGFDDRCEADHLTAPHAMEKPFIKALMSRVALCPVWRVRWVYLAVVRMEW
jgi:hypothetical protein